MFIPNSTYGVKIGDRVRAKVPIDVIAGTFTAGHVFRVESIGDRGPDLVDADGIRCIETGLSFRSRFEKINSY
jgi:hypothetical protein